MPSKSDLEILGEIVKLGIHFKTPLEKETIASQFSNYLSDIEVPFDMYRRKLKSVL